MANTEISDQPADVKSAKSRGGRRWVKVLLVLLLLLGAGSAAAFHFLKDGTRTQKIVEYDEPNVEEAAAKEKAALTEVEKNQRALEKAQTAYDELEKAWETAKTARDVAEKAVQQAPANDKPKAEVDFRAAEDLFVKATKELEDARTRLHEAKNKLKSADEIRAEAEAERKKAEELAKKEEAVGKSILGLWKRSDDYGDLTLELKDDGTGLMVIHFNRTKAFLLGTKSLEVDIKWNVAGGDHLIFDSVSGRPETTFEIISKLRGTHRDEILTKAEEDVFSTQNANDPSRRKNWTRIRQP